MQATKFYTGTIRDATFSVASTNASQQIADAKKVIDGKAASGALITVEDNPVRIRFGDAATTSIGHLLNPGESLRLANGSQVKELNFISATTDEHGTLQITIEFD